jgi:hypothetical protein
MVKVQNKKIDSKPAVLYRLENIKLPSLLILPYFEQLDKSVQTRTWIVQMWTLFFGECEKSLCKRIGIFFAPLRRSGQIFMQAYQQKIECAF